MANFKQSYMVTNLSEKSGLNVKDAWLRQAATFSPSVKEQVISLKKIRKCSVTMGHRASQATIRHLGQLMYSIPQRLISKN